VSDVTKLFTEEQEAFIRENAQGLPNKDLTQLFNDRFNTQFKVTQIVAFKSRHHISSGITGTFQKGQTPHNKGKKVTDYMSAEAIENTKATRFKKGLRPPNRLPIGSERITKDGYTEVKVADKQGNNNFRAKSHVVWEEHNNDRVKPGEAVVYLDKDITNFNPDNLVKITRSDLAIMNKQGLWTEHVKTNEVAINIARLKSKVSERKKG